MRVCVTFILTASFVAGLHSPLQAIAAPAQNGIRTAGHNGYFRLVEDTCWWWGTRWQYGWRGYGWYPCWDWTKPQPTVIAPGEVPPGALTDQCVQNWRDAAGNWHARKLC
jgi:hypothetical protein